MWEEGKDKEGVEGREKRERNKVTRKKRKSGIKPIER